MMEFHLSVDLRDKCKSDYSLVYQFLKRNVTKVIENKNNELQRGS